MPTKKVIKKKPPSKTKLKKAPPKPRAKKASTVPKSIGRVTHFYGHIKVAIIVFKQPIKKGAVVIFSGATTNFTQTLNSMQLDHQPIEVAPKGQEIGVKVGKRVREGDELYAVEE